MRVLVVLNNADKYLEVWESLTGLDVDLHIVAPEAIAARLVERPGLTVHPVQDRFLRPGRETWRIVPAIRRLTRVVDPDLIHLTTEPWSIATMQAVTTGRPVVVHGAEIDVRSGTDAEIAIRATLCRAILPRLAGYVGWSTLAIRSARAEGLPPTVPTLTAPAETPDPQTFASATSQRERFRSAAGWADDEVVVGFVGRHEPQKGLRWLLDAMARATAPRLRLVCVGDGPDADLVRQAGIDSDGRIGHLGPVALESIPEVMASFDMLVIPSISTPEWREQFGRVAIEAMLAGTAIVASDSGALPEVVGEAGRIVPEGDVDILARTIDELARSPRQRAELAAIGRERAQRDYAPTVLAERVEQFWRRIGRYEPAAARPARLAPARPSSRPEPKRQRPVIAVLMASHDRVATTLACLERLHTQSDLAAEIEVFLVDDASTDGTASAVAERFADVHVLRGDGSLFWSGAMRIAQTAARRIRPDFLLWLNDDVLLDPDALARLLETHRRLSERGEPTAIVVGGLLDPDDGSISYAGVTRPDRLRPARFEVVEPLDEARRCESMNGNLVLVPEVVFRRLDGFDGSYRHAMSDFDFGLRATAQGCGVWLAPGTFGTCRRDHADQPWSDPNLGLSRRVRVLLSPKGLPPRDWLHFTRRHTGPLWPLYFLSPYSRFVGRVLQGK